MENRTTGKRRSKEELEQFKSEARNLKFKLLEQKYFKGSDILLKQMQNYERMYREGRPGITDEEWDELLKKTGYVESLDQVVSPSGRKWVKMGTPLVSLRKVSQVSQIEEIFTSMPNEEMIISPKLDGLTYTAFYDLTKDGSLKLEEVGTRGDGLNSLILNDGALDRVKKHGLPLWINKKTTDFLESEGCIIDGRFELRGEAVIDKYEYAKSNDLDLKTLVPRNIAAGMFNRKVSYSIDSVLGKLWEDTKNEMLEARHISSEFEKIWKRTSKECMKMLGGFGIVTRASSIDAIIVAKTEENGLSAFVREKDSQKIRKFNMKTDKGKTRIENLYFISFSVASNRGNIDRPEIISAIPGVEYVGLVEDFAEIFTVTSDFKEAMVCIDKVYGTVDGVRDMSKERMKFSSRFALDGVVIKPRMSDMASQETEPILKNGKMVVPNKPKDQVAVKFETDPVRTKILEIVKRETNLGNITVTAKIEPTVVEGGATVSSVNLHNEEWLKTPENAWIKEGVECDLRMSMDIIPLLSEIKEGN